MTLNKQNTIQNIQYPVILINSDFPIQLKRGNNYDNFIITQKGLLMISNKMKRNLLIHEVPHA